MILTRRAVGIKCQRALTGAKLVLLRLHSSDAIILSGAQSELAAMSHLAGYHAARNLSGAQSEFAAVRITIPDPCLVILCGPAACGKSTFARKRFRSTQIVSSDRCRAVLTDSEESLWASGKAFELFRMIIRMRLGFGRLTVADSTALSRRARADLRRIAREAGVPAVLVVFNVPEGVCLQRDSMRRRRVGSWVIGRHAAMLRDAIANIRHEPYHAVYVLDEREADAATIRRVRGGAGGPGTPRPRRR